MLAHVRRGEGEPLLLLHGLGATGRAWEPVLDRLAAEREVIALDMPGFGASDPLPAGVPPSAANLAAEIAHFCEREEVGIPHAAGNSLGGWVALELGRIGGASSVTALSPAGLWRRPLGPRRVDPRRLARRLRPLISLALRSARGRRALLGTTMAHPERVPPAAARDLVLGWVNSPVYDAANDEMRAAVFDPKGYPRIPVTVAWGELDRLVARPREERLPAGARLLTLAGVGHTPSWDDPELVTEVLLAGSSAAAAVGSAQRDPRRTER
jgi:pimeloyl-ACP methyl ester carboxylesterase